MNCDDTILFYCINYRDNSDASQNISNLGLNFIIQILSSDCWYMYQYFIHFLDCADLFYLANYLLSIVICVVQENAEEQWRKALDFINNTPELNYMTQIIIMMFEDPSKVQRIQNYRDLNCQNVFYHVFDYIYKKYTHPKKQTWRGMIESVFLSICIVLSVRPSVRKGLAWEST